MDSDEEAEKFAALEAKKKLVYCFVFLLRFITVRLMMTLIIVIKS